MLKHPIKQNQWLSEPAVLSWTYRPNGRKVTTTSSTGWWTLSFLSVGGFDVPAQKYDRSPIPGANGDMGENNTASFDPIFFFHHCNIDRVFWLWQKKHGFTDKLEIMDKYPGTNSSDSQGATPGTPPNSWLTKDKALSAGHPVDRLYKKTAGQGAGCFCWQR